MSSKIGKNAKLLMANDLIYTLTAVFIETFLVAYFLQVTNESITTIAIYYIVIYTLLTIGICFLERFIKKIPNKSKYIMSLGVILRALFILFIVLLSDKIAKYYLLIAVIYSLSEIFYWCSHELINIDVIDNENRKHYISIKKVLSKIINIISPIILGSSIELYSFGKIAVYVLILSIIQVIINLLIKIDIKNIPQKYNFKEFLGYIKANKLTKIKSYYLAGVAYGIVEASISTLIIIITIMTFKTSMNLGILTTIFSICSMFSLALYNKHYNSKNASIVLFSCATLLLIGVIGLLFNISKITLIIYNFCYTITFCIFDVVYNTRKGDLVKECNIENFKEEYISYTTISLGIGRIIGYLLMLATSFLIDIKYFKILLLLVTFCAPVYCYFEVQSLKGKPIDFK